MNDLKNLVRLCRRIANPDTELPNELHPLLRRIYSQRGIVDKRELERSVKFLYHWRGLSGMQQAVELLHRTLLKQRQIIVVGDFDVDGATSTALAVLALRSMGGQHVHYLLPSRFDSGYGLSDKVVEHAAARGAGLILTVDNGISSYSGIILARQKGIPVLVTDHHLPGKNLPEAEVIINPNLDNNTFPSCALAGVGVVFYLMLALRSYLRDIGWFSNRLQIPNLADLLDLVALGTVADLVPLDANNRILVWQGINRIRAKKCRIGILALLEIANLNANQIRTRDLGFILGPRINAAGRLDGMSVGVSLLLTEDIVEARILARELSSLNQIRREIEQKMQEKALTFCNRLEKHYKTLPLGLALYHPEWHQGIVGILASRLKDRFHRPVIIFAQVNNDTLKGSGRSISGLHLRNILEHLNTSNPGLILKFGGHEMAVGLSLKKENFFRFNTLFNLLLKEYLDVELLHGVIWSDGELEITDLTLSIAEMLRDAGPWGQAFPEPVFDGRFKLIHQKLIGNRHLKVIVEPEEGGLLLDGIAFNIDTHLLSQFRTRHVQLAYKLDINEFRGNRNLQLLIEHIWPI